MKISKGVTIALWLALAIGFGATLFVRLRERSQLQSTGSRWSSGLANLRTSNQDARRTAAQRLYELVQEKRNAIPGWSSFDPATQANFKYMIGLIADPKEDPATREILVEVAANQGFRDLPEAVMLPLASVLMNESEPSRLRCAIARHAVPAASREPFRGAILATLTSKDDAVRHLAYLTLASMPIDTETLASLLNLGLSDPLPLIRFQAAHQAERLADRGDRAAVDLLLRAAKDQDENVRKAARSAIEHLDPSPADAVPDLIAALNDAEPRLRIALASSLLRTTGQVDLYAPILIDGLRSDDLETWQTASMALWKIGRHSEMRARILQDLTIAMLGKGDDRFRTRAGLTLAMASGDPDAYKPYIVKGLRSNDQELRSWALMASSMTQMRTRPGPQTGPTRRIVEQGLALIAVFGLALIGFFIMLALTSRRTRPRPVAPVPDSTRILILNYPRRNHLRPIAEPAWSDPAAITEQVEALRELGFSNVGPFKLAGSDPAAIARQAEVFQELGLSDLQPPKTADLPGVRLWGLVNPARAITAAIYDHPEWGIFLILRTIYQDGTTYLQTSTHRLDRPDQRPGHEVVYVETTDVPSRLARFLAERPDRPMRPIEVDEFVKDFEHSLADDADWRFARGIMTDREIRDLNQANRNEVTDAQVAEVRRILIEKGNNELDKSLRERFLDSRQLTGEARAKLGPSLVIVHDALPIAWVWEWFPTLIDDEFHAEERARESALYDESLDGEAAPDRPPPWQTLPPRLAFVALNERSGPAERFQKLGALDWPIEADVYQPSMELAAGEQVAL